MLTDTEIKRKGFKILIEKLGDVDAEKFISLIIKEPDEARKSNPHEPEIATPEFSGSQWPMHGSTTEI